MPLASMPELIETPSSRNSGLKPVKRNLSEQLNRRNGIRFSTGIWPYKCNQISKFQGRFSI